MWTDKWIQMDGKVAGLQFLAQLKQSEINEIRIVEEEQQLLSVQ